MTFSELVRERYSVRSFKKDPIEPEKLAVILEAGRVAPTARNFQPQKIYVVKSEDNRHKLASVCRFTFDAPVILVLGYDTERDWKNRLAPDVRSGETDVAIVGTHMMLAAWEQGIGSCWVGYFNPDDVRAVLDLPATVRVTALLPMGYAADDATPLDLHSSYRDPDDTIVEM